MQQGIGKRHICQLSSASEMTNLTTQGYHYQEGVLAGAVLKQQKTDRNQKKKFSFDVTVAFAYPASKRYRLSFSNVLIPNREFVLFYFWSILSAIHGCIDQMLFKKICTEKPDFLRYFLFGFRLVQYFVYFRIDFNYTSSNIMHVLV